MQPLNQWAQGITLILTALYFQAISKKALYLEIAHVVLVAYLLIQSVISLPESPRFLYSKERFDESKEALAHVASYNGVKDYKQENFKFDAEVVEEDQEAGAAPSTKSAKVDPANEFGLTQMQFIANVVLMTALFSCFSFCFWLSDFQAEYIGADIYILFYAQGVIAIVSGQIVLSLYDIIGTKMLIFYSTAVTLVSAAFIIIFQ